MTDRETPDEGFTLVEVLIVTMLLGLIMVALAAVFVVVLRASPAAEATVDDSRSLLTLTNRLSQDVTSTSEYGFEPAVSSTDTNPLTNPTGAGPFIASPYLARCDLSGQPSSIPILQLRWTESTSTFVADYRWEASGGEGKIVRYGCRAGSAPIRSEVTTTLRETPVSSSNNLTPVPVHLTVSHITTAEGLPGNDSVHFEVIVVDEDGTQRELLSLDATTENVVTVLPPLSGGPTPNNQAPTASPGSTSAIAGQLTNYLLPATDPDGDTMTTFFSNIPAGGWLVSATGVNASITPPAAATAGVYTMDYTVTDTSGATATAVLTVTVQAAAVNQPPIVTAANVNALKGQPITIPLVVTDPELGPITISVSGVPGNWGGPTISGLDVTLTPHSGAAGQYVFPYTATDDQGASSSSTLTVNVCDASITSVSPNSVRVNTNGSLQSAVVVTISDNGFCNALVLGFQPQSANPVEAVEAFNSGTTVTIGTTEYVWDVPSGNKNNTLNLRESSNGSIVDTDTLQTRKP
jgi:prepilin-type N-terminal cleavage/methylation domain-containing protein